MSPVRHLVSFCSLTYGVFNLTFWCVPLLLLTLTRLLIPTTRSRLRNLTDAIYRAAVRMNDLWFRHVLGYRWQFALPHLTPTGTYLVIANHQSWVDSFLIQTAVVHRGPILKVLVKEELMRFPVLAMVFWAYDFPRLKRRARRSGDEAERRRRDADRIRAASADLVAAPGAMLVYPEGTRYTPEKQLHEGAPYRHLLRPRPGGLATIAAVLDNDDVTVLDFTLFYPASTRFWQFLSGTLDEPELTTERFPLADVKADPAAWLEARWRVKDQFLAGRGATPAATRTRTD